MASEWDESELDLSEFDSDAAIRLQAVCRGWLVRQQLRDVREEFAQIVAEFDGTAVGVEWSETSLLHRPVITKLSRSLQRQGKSAKISAASSARDTVKNKDCCRHNFPEPHMTNKSEPVSRTRQAHQEVQTSFNDLPLIEQACDDKELGAGNSNASQIAPTSSPNEAVLVDDCKIPTVSSAVSESKTERTGSVSVAAGESVPANVLKDQEIGSGSDGQHHEASDAAVTAPADSFISDYDPPHRTSTFTPLSASQSEGRSKSRAHLSVGEVGASESVSDVSSQMRRVDSFHGDQTSVWDSSISVLQEDAAKAEKPKEASNAFAPPSVQPPGVAGDQFCSLTLDGLRSEGTENLLRLRQNTAMELLWVQQAIISRKKYLKLKGEMEVHT